LKHGKERARLGISSTFIDWTATATLAGQPDCERNRSLLDIKWAERVKGAPLTATRSELTSGFWINTNESVERKHSNKPGVITSTSKWYSYEKDQTLDCRDGMRIHGLPSHLDTSGISEGELRDLAGEGFSAPISTAFVLAFYYLPWGAWWRLADS
jgi:hypothetical protein